MCEYYITIFNTWVDKFTLLCIIIFRYTNACFNVKIRKKIAEFEKVHGKIEDDIKL